MSPRTPRTSSSAAPGAFQAIEADPEPAAAALRIWRLAAFSPCRAAPFWSFGAACAHFFVICLFGMPEPDHRHSMVGRHRGAMPNAGDHEVLSDMVANGGPAQMASETAKGRARRLVELGFATIIPVNVTTLTIEITERGAPPKCLQTSASGIPILRD